MQDHGRSGGLSAAIEFDAGKRQSDRHGAISGRRQYCMLRANCRRTLDSADARFQGQEIGSKFFIYRASPILLL